MTDQSKILVPAPLARVVGGALRIVLCVVLVLAPTAFGNLHRFGSFDLLFVACLLVGVWVVSSLVGVPLTYPRSWANIFLWGVLAVVLLQLLPLPLVNRVDHETLVGPAAAVLTDRAADVSFTRQIILPVGRYSLRPAATLGLLSLFGGAAALYWLTASVAGGRKALRLTTWAAILGPCLLAFWVIIWSLGAPAHPPEGTSQLSGPLMIIGGDSYVPAMLAGLPLAMAAALRLLGWMPRRPPDRRQSRFGWIDRSATMWACIAVLATGVIAMALGMSSVPPRLLILYTALAIGLVVVGYVLAGPGRHERRRPALTAALLVVWVAGCVAAGSAMGRGREPSVSGNDRVQSVIDQVAPHRAIFGVGSGAISPRAVYGKTGWPEAPGNNVNTDGFLVVRAEFGWVGFGLGAVAVLALAVHMVRAWRRSKAPWTRMLIMAGLGALVANLVYFHHDASALLAPNLLVLAAALGVVAAWAGHAVLWRPALAGEVGRAHWPMVGATLGLMAALGIAERNMVTSAAVGDSEIDFKVLHFSAFAFVSLLLCRALGPHPTVHFLKMQVFTAVAWSAAMGVMVEYGQRHLTAGRSFELTDMLINFCGALLAGLSWWVMRRGQVARAAEELTDA
jgi:hypothetical protein